MKPLPIAAIVALVIPAITAEGAVKYKAVMLHPTDQFEESWGLDTSGTRQLGMSSGYAAHSHALLWNGTPESVVDLHPLGFVWTEGTGISGNSQVGFGKKFDTPLLHALLWHGTADSVIDLHPDGFDETYAYDVDGNSQVGLGLKPSSGHALLWYGTAESVVDLQPPGSRSSSATAVSGNRQFGWASPSQNSGPHAMMWSGTAESAVDLHPAHLGSSQIAGASDGSQVGWGSNGAHDEALLWYGTAQSVVDLHPAGFVETRAVDVSGSTQIGSGWGEATGAHEHALLWNGSAESVVDLHQFLAELPVAFVNSYASGINEDGTIVGTGILRDITHEDGNQYQAIMWIPVPEPDSLAIIAGCLGAILFVLHLKRVKQLQNT